MSLRVPQLFLVYSAFVGCMALEGCTPTPPELPQGFAAQVGQIEAPEGEHLLLYPTGDAEGLLGREVQLSEDGGWTIADARSPGCEVSVRKTESQYEREYTANLKSMASVAAGYADLVSLGAKYGSSIEARANIKNSFVLVGDLRGACGSRVIDSVRVGTGERSMLRSAEAGGGAKAVIEGVPLGAGSENKTEIGGRFAWQNPQGYAFTYKEFEATEPIGLSISVPTRIEEGSKIDIAISAKKQVWLVVFFLESNDRGGVLIPMNGIPEAVVPAGGTYRLPPARATLRQPGVAARETMIAYAFTERADFESLKPPIGTWEEDAAKYAAELTSKLSSIPIRRWDRTAVSYVIEPTPGAPAQPAPSAPPATASVPATP